MTLSWCTAFNACLSVYFSPLGRISEPYGLTVDLDKFMELSWSTEENEIYSYTLVAIAGPDFNETYQIPQGKYNQCGQ